MKSDIVSIHGQFYNKTVNYKSENSADNYALNNKLEITY